jgi:predicted Fe-Mo cluster-binding NifX family protein
VGENKRRKLVVIGQDCVEPLQALRSAGIEVVCLAKSCVIFLSLVNYFTGI